MARVHFAGVIEDDSYADVPVTEHLSTARRRDSHGSKDGKQEPEFIFCDWDQKELDAVRRCGLKYTIRSSKYPRTQQTPHRTHLHLNNTHTFSVHTVLLHAFTPLLSAALKTLPPQDPSHIHISASPPLSSPHPWTLLTTWLYTLDKIPLPDYTPPRPPNTPNSTLLHTALLSSFLRAQKFEKYLCRIISHDLYYARLPDTAGHYLAARMAPWTGMHHFCRQWVRWREAGRPGELDPWRWRVEHWYAVCGREGCNWGCFHAMSTAGWGGVWERQRGMRDSGRVRREVEMVVGDGDDYDEQEDESEGDGDSEEDVEVEKKATGPVRFASVSAVDGSEGRGAMFRSGWGFDGAGGAYVHGGGCLGSCCQAFNSWLASGDGSGSGEELWDEWWEDEDMYSRIGEVIDLGFQPECGNGEFGDDGD